jgi:hypothetical protein
MSRTSTIAAPSPRRFAVTVAATLILTILMTLLLSAPAGAQQAAQHRLTGDQVAVYNLAGQVTVMEGRGSEVVIEVTRMGREAEGLEIATGVIRGVNTLRVIYPEDRIHYGEMSRLSTTQLRVRDDGTFGGSSSRRARRVTITGGRGMDAWADIRVMVPAGRDVRVYIGAGGIKADGVRADLTLDTHSGEVTATRIRGRVVADTGSGRVSLSEIQGDVTADTGSGRVTLTGIRGDRVLVDTGSGRVTASDVTAERIDVDTGSGSVSLDRVSSSYIRVDTGSGSVEVELLTDVRTLEVDTGSGGVTVWIPAALGADFEIDTGSGGIDVEVPADFRRKSRSYATGQIGDGNGRIYIDTGSGGVRLRKK